MSQPILVLAPLREGQADAVRAAIAALDEPFARVPGAHLARLQVLHPPPRRSAGTRHYILLAADHDGPVEPWLAAAARELAPALAHCAFWPVPATRPRSWAGRGLASCAPASRWWARRTPASRTWARRSRCASASRRSRPRPRSSTTAALQAAWRKG